MSKILSAHSDGVCQAPAPPAIDHGVDEAMIRNAFECHHVDGTSYPAIFKPNLLDERNKSAMLALIEEGLPMGDLESAYIAMASPGNPGLVTRVHSRNADHRRCFSSILQCLLGTPDHKDKVMAYLLENMEAYRKLSFGLLGGRGMYSTVGGAEGSKHRPSCVFSTLLKSDPTVKLSNLCRNSAGDVWDTSTLDQMLILESDAYGFLMSAIANRDRLGIEGLMRSGSYMRFIGKEDTLMLVGDMIEAHPEWELDVALRPLLTVRNNETAMIEAKRLIDSIDATVEQCLDVLWPDISPLAVSHLVGFAIKNKGNGVSASNFLSACVASGFDLYLGTVEARSGFGAALDAFGELPGEQDRHAGILESYLRCTFGGVKQRQLAPLVLVVPPAMLASHSEASSLLLERYRLTGDKSLLALGDRKFRGLALEDDLGL